MNVFIIFVKLLGWIVVFCVRLVRLIRENESLKFWKGDTSKKKKYIISINK